MSDIELVIKIPEEIYKASQILEVKYEDTVQIPLEVIANGTPLPKGHGRLIDAEVFAHYVVKYSHQSTKTIGQALADTPSIIEADRSENE